MGFRDFYAEAHALAEAERQVAIASGRARGL